MSPSSTSKIKLISSMLIFGTIGIFVKYIPLPSSVIALVRGVIGTLFLLIVALVSRKKLSFANARKRLILLFVSGALIGFNWIFLFESYNYTTVAVSTLCYYMQPTFVIIASAVFFKERITLRKAICVILALVGMVFVSGIIESGIPSADELKGVLFGLGAAVIYSAIILVNQKLTGIDSYTKTIIQLFSAAITIFPYILFTEDVTKLTLDTNGTLLLVIVAVVHTGIAYFLYFGSMENLKAHTIAIMSYIDPVTAIILSALFLREPITPAAIVGALLILGAAFVSELPSRKS